MSREPEYSEQALRAIQQLEAGDDAALLEAVADAIDLICDHGDSAEARREQLRTRAGNAVWKVSVRSAHDWVVLWWPDGDAAVIAFIGRL